MLGVRLKRFFVPCSLIAKVSFLVYLMLRRMGLQSELNFHIPVWLRSCKGRYEPDFFLEAASS